MTRRAPARRRPYTRTSVSTTLGGLIREGGLTRKQQRRSGLAGQPFKANEEKLRPFVCEAAICLLRRARYCTATFLSENFFFILVSLQCNIPRPRTRQHHSRRPRTPRTLVSKNLLNSRSRAAHSGLRWRPGCQTARKRRLQSGHVAAADSSARPPRRQHT